MEDYSISFLTGPFNDAPRFTSYKSRSRVDRILLWHSAQQNPFVDTWALNNPQRDPAMPNEHPF